MRRALHAVALATLSLWFFWDPLVGGFASTGGGDSGNHLRIAAELASGATGIYQGFTAFHWMFLGLRSWGLTSIHAVALLQWGAAWLTLALIAYWLFVRKTALLYAVYFCFVASLRILMGEGYYTQVFSWPILATLWVYAASAAEWSTLRLGVAFALVGSLRSVYGVDIPLLCAGLAGVACAQAWVRRRNVLAWMFAAGSAAAAVLGCMRLRSHLWEGGGFLRYGVNEALIAWMLGLAIAAGWMWRDRRRKPWERWSAAEQLWVSYTVLSGVFLLVMLLEVRSAEYYFVKALLFPTLIALAGLARRRQPQWVVALLVLALVGVFHRYAALTVGWRVAPQLRWATSNAPEALLDARSERWLRDQVGERNCVAYAYVTRSWTRYNWAMHAVGLNRASQAQIGNFWPWMQQAQLGVPAYCVFVERAADVRKRIQPDWTCTRSSVESIGEICAQPLSR